MTANEAGSIAGFVAGAVIYLLPALNAYSKRHRSRALIAVCTVLFGWTVIGWLLCLAWSMGSSVDQPRPAPGDLVACPHCAETIRKAARICRHCGRSVHS